MSRLSLMVVMYLGIFIGLVSLARANITQEGVALDLSHPVNAFPVSCSDGGTVSAPAPHLRGARRQPELSTPQEEKMRGGLSDMLVQARGWTCITPSAWCRLKTPAPISAPCCCPSGACGYVGP
jgi:hypothetical protein